MSRHLRNFDVAGLLTEQGFRVTKSWVDPVDSGVLVVADGPTGPTPPQAGLVPTGSVTAFAGSAAPTEWLLCNGAVVLVADYPALYAVIGYTYGGSGLSFYLPNLKGRMPVGLDATQTEFNAMAKLGGSKTHTLTVAQMPIHTHVQNSHTHIQDSHNHIQDAHQHDVYVNGASRAQLLLTVPDASTANRYHIASGSGTPYLIAGPATATNQAATATNQSATAVNQNAGGDGSHPILAPYIVMNYIIKT